MVAKDPEPVSEGLSYKAPLWLFTQRMVENWRKSLAEQGDLFLCVGNILCNSVSLVSALGSRSLHPWLF